MNAYAVPVPYAIPPCVGVAVELVPHLVIASCASEDSTPLVLYITPVVNPDSIMFPVCPPPRVNAWLLTVCKDPLDDRTIPVPLTPEDIEATGVPEFTLSTENLAD